VTDDGELALALARCLVRTGGYHPDWVADAYVAWYESGPFDIGGTTRQAFGGRVEKGPGLARRLERRASGDSQANGSLMRISPLGIWGWALPAERLAELAEQDSRLSHPHAYCQAACVVFTHAVARGIRGASPEEVYENVVEFATSRPPLQWAVGVLREAKTTAPREYSAQQGWVRIALQNAFYQLRHSPSVEEGVVETVAKGGDTDTNGAIAAALLGAVHGEDLIPERWRRAVLECRTDRGPTYQAGDACEPAEALVNAGSGIDPTG
jgi:ADP-ribosylglycohydrolase